MCCSQKFNEITVKIDNYHIFKKFFFFEKKKKIKKIKTLMLNYYHAKNNGIKELIKKKFL